MPIEPNLTQQTTETLPASAIENEIPTYRAISALAVFSLICGVLAILSFAHWSFLISAAAAIVLGILADRKIVRLSDVLTGRQIAQAGIALGLIFGLAAITTTTVQDFIQVREAKKFAKIYEDVINKGTFEDALWYGQNPLVRKGKTPQEIVSEMRQSMRGASMMDLEHASLKDLRTHISDEGAKLHFLRIEQYGKDKLDLYAAALFELDRPANKEHSAEKEFALAVLKGWNTNRRYEWWVESISFPYKLDSYKPAPKPVDDGHGHAH